MLRTCKPKFISELDDVGENYCPLYIRIRKRVCARGCVCARIHVYIYVCAYARVDVHMYTETHNEELLLRAMNYTSAPVPYHGGACVHEKRESACRERIQKDNA